mgnify:CR=1 FL=1
MAIFNKKLSNLVKHQGPDFVLEDHPKFAEFVRLYYQFLESAEVTLKDISPSDGILLETETSTENYLLLDGTNLQGITQLNSGDKVAAESTTTGKFTLGETITGADSGATATILGEDITATKRIFISANNKFQNEVVTGGTSGASATISKYRANPVENIQQLLDYTNIDTTIYDFLGQFRNEFLNTIPDTLATGVDKRKLVKNVKSLYRSKGSKEGHKLFFRLLFNENADITLPKEQMLHVSDGKWNTKLILRATTTGTNDTSNLVGQTITQADDPLSASVNLATAIVESVIKLTISGTEVTEFTLNEDSISGTFIDGIEISGTDSTDEDKLVKATVTGIPSTFTLSNDGSLYKSGDTLTITGGGTGCSMTVDEVGRGGITEILVDSVGSGYTIGDPVVFSSGSAEAKLSVVNGGIALESGDLDEYGYGTVTTDHIVLESATMKGDPYVGDKFVQEANTGTGDITDVIVTKSGQTYNGLPTLTITSSGGSSATLKAYGSEIGRIQKLKVLDYGRNYGDSPSPPTIEAFTNVVLTGVTGTYAPLETVTLASSSLGGTVSSFTPTTGLLVLKTSDIPAQTLTVGDTITGATSSATGTIQRYDEATITATVDTTATTSGAYINEDGHASENAQKIQDSKLYQDYSYIVRIGKSINEWRDAFKKTVHPGGFYFIGQVDIATQLDAKLKSAITGERSGKITDFVFMTLNTLFTTLFGRRLGTEDDGTTLRSSPQAGHDIDVGDSVADTFSSTTRDLTLKRAKGLKVHSRVWLEFASRSLTSYRGAAYAGPRTGNLKQPFSGGPFGDHWSGTIAEGTGINIGTFDDIKIEHTQTNRSVNSATTSVLHGTGLTLDVINETPGLKMNFKLPAEVRDLKYEIVAYADSFGQKDLTIRGVDLDRGFAYAGPRLSNIIKHSSGIYSNALAGSPSFCDISHLNEIRLTGTGNTSLDGELLQVRDYDQNLKCNFAFPSEIASSTTLST